jgi:hypothetical protein
MTAIPWFHPFRAITASTGFYSDGRYFDLNNPKIVLGLLIGGMIPYFLPAIPAAATKWLILVSVLDNRPRPSRICVVALLEPLCFSVGMVLRDSTLLPLWLSLPKSPFTLLILPVWSTLTNLLLFPPGAYSGESGYHFPRRILYAFTIGLVYWVYLALVLLALGLWLEKY